MDKQDFKGIIPFKTAEDYNAWRAGTFTKGGEDFPAYSRNILAVLPDEQSQYVETGIEERVEQLEANAGGGKLYEYVIYFGGNRLAFIIETKIYSSKDLPLYKVLTINEFYEKFGGNHVGFDALSYKLCYICIYTNPMDSSIVLSIDNENKINDLEQISIIGRKEV
jgi:hypothetical protein